MFTVNIKGAESKAEFFIEDGKIIEIRYSSVRGRRPLTRRQMDNFKTVVEYHAEEIVQKWIDYFVFHKQVESKTITRKI